MSSPGHPSPAQLWQQAGSDPTRFRDLMRAHGYLTDSEPEPLPCRWPTPQPKIANGKACGSCGTEIVFARITRTGSSMPVNAKPDPAGNLAVHRDPSGRLQARVLREGDQPGPHEKRGMPHFATCPHAARHRGKSPPPASRLPPNVVPLRRPGTPSRAPPRML